MDGYECSSKGDKRFSAFYARINRLGNRSIEDLYQVELKGYSSIKEGKGKPGKKFSYDKQEFGYERLWFGYLQENPHLVDELLEITKTKELTDMFAKPNSINQADALTSIITKIRKGELFIMARKHLAEVEDSGKDRLGIGAHEVTITAVEMTTTSKTNAPMAKLTLENDEGIVWDNLVMVETALGFSKRYLSACEYDIDDLDFETGKGKAKEHVLFFYMDNAKGEEEEWTIDQLLLEEKVIVTLKEGDKTYKDPVTGDTITKDKPGVKIASIEAA